MMESNRALFEGLGSAQKLFLSIACGIHYMARERPHLLMHEASLEWLESTTLKGADTGRFRADEAPSMSAEE